MGAAHSLNHFKICRCKRNERIGFSDLVRGFNADDDFDHCCYEVAHIRAALRLFKQSSKGRTRYLQPNLEE